MPAIMPITREKLLAFVAGAQYRPAKMKELARSLSIPQTEYRDFRRLVKDLVGEGLLVRAQHNRYVPPMALNQAVGRLKVHARGFGLVARSGGESDIFIPVADIREVVRSSFAPRVYEPSGDTDGWEVAYRRFCRLLPTGNNLH